MRVVATFLMALLFLVACSDSSDEAGSSDAGGLTEGTTGCTITQGQVLDPSLNATVPNGLDATLCDFGVFGWESFLYLVSPSGSDPQADPSSGLRRFLNVDDYPQYDGQGVDSCREGTGILGAARTFYASFVATRGQGIVVPEAGAGTIYSFEGASSTGDNVILYNIRFSRDLCTATGPNLPADLVEIKTAWRFLPDEFDRSRYYWRSVTLPGGTEITLGLIGFHLAQVTEYHPEMIWTTWEHVDNAPDCVEGPRSPLEPDSGWTMNSPECASCLRSPLTTDCSSECVFLNQARDAVGDPALYAVKADPTDVCRVYPQGTQAGDVDSAQNRSNIVLLNQQVAGPTGYLASLPESDPQAVWKNYQMLGSTWFHTASEDDPAVFVPPDPGTNQDRQRGSIKLAHSVMETTFQGGPVDKVPSAPDVPLNCFSCHNAQDYDATLTSNSPFGLSHIEAYIHGD